MRVCKTCKIEKPFTEYYRDRSCPKGFAYACKVCTAARAKAWRDANPERIKEQMKNWRCANKAYTAERSKECYVKRRFGISLKEYNALMDSASACASCGIEKGTPGFIFHLDHDHKTGKVRDVLCHKCNVTLGLMRDNPATILSLVEYLKKHETKSA